MTDRICERLCFQCMHELKEPGTVCPKCGYDNARRKNETGFLQETVLKGQYYVGKALGRGGFGVTYAGYDLNLERRVAIKEYFPTSLTTRDGVTANIVPYTDSREQFRHGQKRALDEGRVTANMGHVPNVVHVYNAFRENGTVYIVMEYIDGVTLARMVKSRGRMDWQQAFKLLYPIMKALELVHAKNIIHRDVSPDNIMLDRSTKDTVLLDFGAARSFADMKQGMTQNLRPGFAPIEQYSSTSQQDGRVDEYAICATMYYLVTGIYPASADKRAFLDEKIPMPRELGTEMPEAVEAVLLKGMSVKADDRYGSMKELREAFEQVIKGTQNRKVSDTSDIKQSAANKEKKPNRKAFLAAAAVIVAAAVAVIVWFARPKPINPDAQDDPVPAIAEVTEAPTEEAMEEPSEAPTAELTEEPTPEPTEVPTPAPTETPTPEPVPTPVVVLKQDDAKALSAIRALNRLWYLDSIDHSSFDFECWFAFEAFCEQNHIAITEEGIFEDAFNLLTGTDAVPAPTATPEPTVTPVPEIQSMMRSDELEGISSLDFKKQPVLGSSYLRSSIRTVRFIKGVTDRPQEAWDVSSNGDGLVWAWATRSGMTDDEGNKLYDLTIAGNDGVKLNPNSSRLFAGYINLESIDFGGVVDTGDVSNMSYMFYGCSRLTSLDVAGFNTANVTTMSSMFHFCSNLTLLDVSGFDTSNVTKMSSMFHLCKSLAALDVSGFDTANVTSMDSMFYSCSNLTTLDVSGFDTSNVTSMGAMFQSCSSLMTLDVSGFDTAQVTTMSHMFAKCSSLTSLDLSSLDTTNVIYMGNMFEGLMLTELDLSNFHTANVTDMWEMFKDCSRLEILNLSSFDTSNVTDMYGMFNGCSSLTALDLSGFNTAKVRNMKEMFRSCSSLGALNLSSFDTSQVTDMGYMFCDCSGLTLLNVTSFNTANVTDMAVMFYGCSLLTSLDVSSFNTAKVSNMTSMFRNCSSLKSLNLSSFDMSQVNRMSYMFKDCSSLTSLNIPDVDTMVINWEEMFDGCPVQLPTWYDPARPTVPPKFSLPIFPSK